MLKIFFGKPSIEAIIIYEIHALAFGNGRGLFIASYLNSG